MNEKQLVKDLCEWYRIHQRKLPWRNTKDPYFIWVSEIMLQQTQVDTVIPYYLNFIQHFENIQSLANASDDEIYKCWQGLGYYRRAKHLKEASHDILQRFNGQFPTRYEDIHSLKGIGDYTASAIASIAFEIPRGVVDGNVLRIISRIYLIKDNIVSSSTHKYIQSLVDRLILEAQPSIFNQAMMDLGATLCKPKNPLCSDCPVQRLCLANKHNQQSVLPISIKKKNIKEIHYITGVITYKNRYLLVKEETGLLSNLYSFIQYDLESPYTFIDYFKEKYNLDLRIERYIKDIKHVFSHRVWYMHVYHFTLNEPNPFVFYTKEEIERLPISTAHLKVWNSYLNEKK